MEACRPLAAIEGEPISPPENTIVGRLAGDRVCLVGDYEGWNLWEELPHYRNVSQELVEAWNGFIELPELKLTYKADCSCCQ